MELLFTKSQLEHEISKVASDIKSKINIHRTTFVCVLKGTYKFFGKLMDNLDNQELNSNLKIAYYMVKSYEGIRSTNSLEYLLRPSMKELANDNIIIVDDILDTGYTINEIFKDVSCIYPKAIVYTCVLLTKIKNREYIQEATWSCFHIEDKFVIGWGLDYKDRFRNLDSIYSINSESEIPKAR